MDTHKHTHHAAVIDDTGQLIEDQQFGTDSKGEEELLSWLRSQGHIVAVGVEGTGSFGVGVARHLTNAGLRVVEVNRPNREARRRDGKSDRLDAEQAARAVLATTATATPKSKDGPVEAVRTLRVTRSSAVKSRTQAFLTLHGIVVGCPRPCGDELTKLTKRTLVKRCAGLRPETEDLLDLADQPDRLHLAASKGTPRDLARRWLVLDEEVKALDRQIKGLSRSQHRSSSSSSGSASNSPDSSSSPPATTTIASRTKQRSPSSAASPLSRPAADERVVGTG